MSTLPNLLVISDLHLGETLGRGRKPDPRTEEALIAFLDHHASRRRGGRPWRLIINGDAVDLIGMCWMPDDAGRLTGHADDDHLYGLGERSEATTLKLAEVFRAHDGVFRALAAFVGAGHDLVLVLGNHDAEMFWPAAQQLFREALASRWAADPRAVSSAVSPDDVRRAVAFQQWFHLEEGVAWIEHGHQYDPYCSFDDVLEPVTDEHSIDPNVGGAILRYVANHFTADPSEHWGSGFVGYLCWWARQGLDKAIDILGGYRDMVAALVRHWQQRRPERLAARAARTRERLRRLASALHLPDDRLERLAALRSAPVVVDLGRLVRAVMLDRLLLLFATPLLWLLPLALPWSWMPWSWSACLGVWALWTLAALIEREDTDPRQAMRDVAKRIRASMSVPFVVMGHSHDACADVADDGVYFNTGTWVPHGPGVKAFTHLLVERGEGSVRAMLCQWRGGESAKLHAADQPLGAPTTAKASAKAG
jgi:UDP-2,3-diacylglucosamine pyrophosphatase LpxH